MNFSVDDLSRLFAIIANSPAATTFSVIGFILLFCGMVISRLALKSPPSRTPKWVKFGLFGCLIWGVLFAALGPTIALLSFSRHPILTVSPEKAFDNLETNERVYWLIRLIPYEPKNNPEFAIGALKQLGPPNQAYTFVAAYDELIGYGVGDALRMAGGTSTSEQRVSTIIFPVASIPRATSIGGFSQAQLIYPANARGLLQVIQQIEDNPNNKIDKRLLNEGVLSKDELDDLRRIDALNYWRFENYKQHFRHYCELSQTFRCDTSYSARNYIGGVNIDWHPLGFAQKNIKVDSCTQPVSSYCSISNWHDAKTSLEANFGARIFLIQNLQIDSISNRFLIDFGNPGSQFIPDIGLRATGG
jgi:hypothetical protein